MIYKELLQINKKKHTLEKVAEGYELAFPRKRKKNDE